MNWIKMTIRTTTEGAELVTALLMELGINGAMIEDKNDIALNQRPEGQWDIIDEAIALRMDDDVLVSSYIAGDERAQDTIAHVRESLARLSKLDVGFDKGKLTLEVSSIDDEDWAENWKSQYKPFRLGSHFVVKPTWEHYLPKEGDQILEIDPGMAFGTGTHETTGMCVALAEQYVKPGDRVIDVGTGTGILAIAAAYMGARDVLAIDIDPVAVRVARDNIVLNGLADKITAREGDLLEAVDEVADVVIANIIADVICMLAEPVKAHIKKNGLFICSGIARERQDEVISALNAAGYQDLDVRNQGEWAAICARRV
ncbi:MAG: 50S ribosomal protein L11 methyltransferase [Eubacteriales bacterium]|nr:50S ribosomal protein L11 methyltransferase [bacterium]MDY2793234.1 50S ribosomal protein L11 methyltransferase [Eubacteriales bacterium]